MKTNTRAFIGTAAFLLAFLMLGGCSKHQPELVAPSTAQSESTTQTAPSENLPAESPEPEPNESEFSSPTFGARNGDAAKTLVALTDATYAPFEFMDAKGQPTGFDVELLSAIAMDQGYNVKFISKPFPKLFTTLVTNKSVDLVISCLTATEDRAKVSLFSDPYLKIGSSITTRKSNNDIKSIMDLKGRKVSFIDGSVFKEDLDKLFDGDYTPIPARSHYFAIRELILGQSDALISDAGVLDYNVHKYAENDLKVFTDTESIPTRDAVIAVSKDKPEVLKIVNQGLKNIKENGTYDLIHNKWLNHMKFD